MGRRHTTAMSARDDASLQQSSGRGISPRIANHVYTAIKKSAYWPSINAAAPQRSTVNFQIPIAPRGDNHAKGK